MLLVSPEFIEDLWYGKHPLSIVLVPLAWCYQLLMIMRHLLYQSGILPTQKLNVPVIVVGNIVVGGTGKTPLVIWLTEYLKEKGYRPGIVSRGYKSKVTQWPQQVRKDSNPELVGDEPVLLARKTGCPVAIAPNRYVAAKALIEHEQVDIVICDDGLQHYALERDIEIAVIDGIHRHGNGRCLPAGPLREPVGRLKSVDMIVCNSGALRGEFEMQYIPQELCSVTDENRHCDIDQFRNKSVHAIAGVGNPRRFFSSLRGKGVRVIEHEFPDHYQFRAEDIFFADDFPVVMTEKDAVKCTEFASEQHWYLPINVNMTNAFEHRLTILLKDINNGQKAT
ncbi:MAG: tetraacyldisaccharide 4'-kinase [Gammaproteobacteria bacterium]